MDHSKKSYQNKRKIGTVLVLEVQKEVLVDQSKQIEWVAQIFSCPDSEKTDYLSKFCQSRLVINNIEYENVPDVIFDRLLSFFGLRRGFSSDYFSGGILKQEKKMVCAGNPYGTGLVLKTLYKTSEDIAPDKSNYVLQEVYSESLTCSYPYVVAPIETKAKEEARATIEIINTLKEMLVTE